MKKYDINLRNVAQDIKDFRASIDKYTSEYEAVKQQYPKHYLAYYKGEFIAANTNLKKLIKELKNKGIKPESCYVPYTKPPKYPMIFKEFINLQESSATANKA